MIQIFTSHPSTFSLNASIKNRGLVTIIRASGESGPDRDGLVFDLDAENADSPVTSWPDTSGHANNAVLTGTLVKTPNVINGFPAIGTDAATSFVTIPVTPTEPFTLFVVAIAEFGSRSFGSASSFSWGGFGPGGNWAFFNGEGGPVIDLGIASNTWTLHEVELITAPPGPSGYGSSGNSRLNGAAPVTVNRVYIAGSESNLQLGANGAGGEFGSVQVTRVIGFSKVLSTEVKAAWRTYLADRYGITIA